MRYFFILSLLGLSLVSCNSKSQKNGYVIVENGEVNTEFLYDMHEEDRALISWYLFAYGNECVGGSEKIKCQLLVLLNIDNECDAEHINYLKKWFSTNKLLQFKLQNCPNLPHNFAIQNTIEKMSISRLSDTITFTIKVRGLNSAQEKSWNIKQTDKYILDDNLLKSVNL